MITIEEVKTGKQKKEFASLPLELYKGVDYYVPSLFSDEVSISDEKKNFAAENCIVKQYLAYKDGKTVGRIAAIINNKFNEQYSKKCIRFSRFDFIDDSDVAKALLDTVAEFGRSQGMELLHGPWGFNDTDREGMLTYGFDKRSTYATNYNYEYYPRIMEGLGYEKESEWIESKFIIPKEVPERLTRMSKLIEKKFGLSDATNTLNVRQFIKQYGDDFFDVFNQCYRKLDNYVDIGGKVKKSVLKQFATIINPRYYSVIINKKDEVVAFGIALPSICEALKKSGGKLLPTGFISLLKSIKKPEELELALVGVRPDYQKLGINALVIHKILKNIIEDNIKTVESNPTLSYNSAVRSQFDFVESEVIKKRQTYKIKL